MSLFESLRTVSGSLCLLALNKFLGNIYLICKDKLKIVGMKPSLKLGFGLEVKLSIDVRLLKLHLIIQIDRDTLLCQ